AVSRMAGLLGADAYREIALMALTIDRDLALHQPLRPFARGLHDIIEFRQHIGQWMTQSLRFGVTDQLFSRAIENADTAGGIDPDDAGACRGQHRLDEAAAVVDQ